jgi:hypothetical protein
MQQDESVNEGKKIEKAEAAERLENNFGRKVIIF